ncbi:MAG: DUF2889 domain-containing protein [Alphaproteobacteria bacterium]|nr:DUF2889 domain-containing protein [Alphaproteobacteria bacterium]
MPLPSPAAREHIHTRKVHCQGFRRADGLWDIEGHITDTKTYGFGNRERGRVPPGAPIHDMSIRLTVDDALTIRAVEAVTEASPYRICADVTPNFQRLVGLTIGPGFRRQVRERLGGTEGCTHLVELLGPVGTTAFQTVVPLAERDKKTGREADGASRRRPALLNSCYAFSDEREVVARQWPDFIRKPPANE